MAIVLLEEYAFGQLCIVGLGDLGVCICRYGEHQWGADRLNCMNNWRQISGISALTSGHFAFGLCLLHSVIFAVLVLVMVAQVSSWCRGDDWVVWTASIMIAMRVCACTLGLVRDLQAGC